MKIALIYFNSFKLPSSRIHHEVKSSFLTLWQKTFKKTNSKLEPILMIDTNTTIPKDWEYGVQIIKNSDPPFMVDVLNKVGWMKAQCYEYLGKCIVSDIDAIINNNFDELITLDCPMAMAFDKSRRTYTNWPQIGEELNAGFMLLNDNKIFSLFETLYHQKKEYNHITFYDELIFSHICRQINGTILPIEYNQTWETGDFFTIFSHFANKKNKIIHFHGNRKKDLEKIQQYENLKINKKFRNLDSIQDKFLILSNQRSGSHFLQSLLNSHSQINFAGEALINPTRWIQNNDNNKSTIIHKTLLNYCGFIYHREYPDKEYFQQFIKSNKNIGIIFLFRKNILKQFISLKIAEKNKKFQNNVTTERISIDFNEFYDFHHKMKKLFIDFWIFLNENNIRTFVVEYENIHKEIYKLQEFMNLNIEELNTKLIKQENRKIQDIVINYDELKQFLSKKELIRYLDDSF